MISIRFFKLVIISLSVIILVACKKDMSGIMIAVQGTDLKETPSYNGKKVGHIPFGAKLNILDTEGPQAVLEGNRDSWYQVKIGDATGWVFGGHINRVDSKTHLLEKNLTLEAESFFAVCATDNLARSSETIRLTKTEAYYTGRGDYGNVEYESNQKGTYIIENDGIRIQLHAGVTNEKDTETSSVKTIPVKARVIKLYWDPQYNGYLTDETIKFKNNPQYIINQANCSLMTKESMDNDALCKNDPVKGGG